MVGTPPPSLAAAVELFASYLDRLPDAPFLAIGEVGSGRGHWIRALLEDRRFHPLWMYENIEAPALDYRERRIFPVYDLPTPELPASSPSVLLAPMGFARKDEFKVLEFAVFPEPPIWEREAFLAGRGYPKELADGNPDYAALRHAMIAWNAAHLRIRAGPSEHPTWDGFREGGDAPVPDGLLAYYAAYAFPPQEWWPNRNLGMARRVPASIGRMLTDQLRLEWPPGNVPFPEILKEARSTKGPAPPGTARDLPPRPKTYAVDW